MRTVTSHSYCAITTSFLLFLLYENLHIYSFKMKITMMINKYIYTSYGNIATRKITLMADRE